MTARRGPIGTLIIVTAVLLLLTAATPAHAAWFKPEERLTTESHQQMYPDISGNKVVFQNDRWGSWDIYVLDLSSMLSKRLTTSSGAQTEPRIAGSNVVYMDDRFGAAGDVYLYDLASDVERRLTPSAASQAAPVISGNRVLYRDGSGDLHVYDLGSGQDKHLVTGVSVPYRSSINGTRVAYLGWDGSGYDVYVYDLLTDDVVRVTTTGDASQPCISGTRVAYDRIIDGVSVVHIYDVTTHSDRTVDVGQANPYQPRLDGDRLYYLTSRAAAGWNVYVHDLDSDVERLLVSTNGLPQNVAVSGGRYVYQDVRNGNCDIYSKRIQTVGLTLQAPATVAYGAQAGLSGTLVSANGLPLSNRRVDILQSLDGLTWTPVASATTGATGKFSVKTPALIERCHVRAKFASDWANLGTTSRRATIKPGVYLTAPRAPATVTTKAAAAVTGTLKPRHTAGTFPVSVQFSRLETVAGTQRWVLKQTLRAKVADAATSSSTYSCMFSTSLTGSWRARAYHAADADGAATTTRWTAFDVK